MPLRAEETFLDIDVLVNAKLSVLTSCEVSEECEIARISLLVRQYYIAVEGI